MQQLQQMNNVWTQRLDKLRARESSTVRVIQWLKENQQLFRQPILEPVCMSLNVRDPRYAKQVEAFFSGRDFFSFVAQNEEDRETFLKQVSTPSMLSNGPLSIPLPSGTRQHASEGEHSACP